MLENAEYVRCKNTDIKSFFLKLYFPVFGDTQDAISIYIFKIEPPFLCGVRPTISHQIIAPDTKLSSDAYMSHRPVDCPVEGCVWLAPGTNLDTGTAA